MASAADYETDTLSDRVLTIALVYNDIDGANDPMITRTSSLDSALRKYNDQVQYNNELIMRSILFYIDKIFPEH